MGKELDALNSYNNAKAAERVADPHGNTLFTHDWARRVLDAKHLDFTYGQRVLSRERQFAVMRVKKAVACSLQTGVKVFIVGNRHRYVKLCRMVKSPTTRTVNTGYYFYFSLDASFYDLESISI